MPIYSHSRIGCYETCPLQYKYRYVEIVKVEKRDSIEMYLGSRVHEAIQKIYHDRNQGKEVSLNSILEFFNTQWHSHWHDNVEIADPNMTAEDYRKSGEDAITKYYERHQPFNDGQTVGIEFGVSIDLFGNGRYKLRGFIDRLVKTADGTFEIHDYKTSKHLLSQDDADSDRQLALYQLGIRGTFPDAKDIKLVWHYLKFDKRIESRRTEADLVSLRRKVGGQIDQIEIAEKSKSFPARISPLCKYCDFKGICPALSRSNKVTIPSAAEPQATSFFRRLMGVVGWRN